jgi:hypothetical protein
MYGGNEFLYSPEVAKPTAEVMQQLAELHPVSPEPKLEAPETVPSQISRGQLKQTIRRLPKGSAPGPSGWTFEHIQVVLCKLPLKSYDYRYIPVHR